MTSPCSCRRCHGLAVVLPARATTLQEALSELTESVTAVLGLCGSWVTMADDGRLRFVTAVSQASAELQRDHAQLHPFPCPCRDAYSTGEVIRVTDVREESTRWPEFSATATRLSVAGVAAIPMRLADQIIGALNLYSPEPREWSDEDIAVAGVLADVATSYVVNASKLRQQQQLSEQLQEALESRIVIEQAKGNHRIQALDHDRSGRPADAPARPQQRRQLAGRSRSDCLRGTAV